MKASLRPNVRALRAPQRQRRTMRVLGNLLFLAPMGQPCARERQAVEKWAMSPLAVPFQPKANPGADRRPAPPVTQPKPDLSRSGCGLGDCARIFALYALFLALPLVLLCVFELLKKR